MIVRIFIVLLMVLGVSMGEAFAARAPSYASGARDMSDLLSLHESIDHLTGTGRTYRAFVSSERERVDQILQKYAYISRILTIRPTLDRSLSYHLRIQQYSLSCEITATQIVLEALGILQTESEILDQIPQLPSRLSGGIWGDPDREFVGSYRGSQRKATGYGVYEAPIADVFHRYGFSTWIINATQYRTDMDASRHMAVLLSALHDPDTHVILWADFCTDPSDEDGVFARPGSHIMRFFPLGAKNQCDRPAEERIMRWKTPDGRTIEGLSGEHAFVLLGYLGSRDQPTGVIVWDTDTGRHVYPYDAWMKKWNALQNRSLIISRNSLQKGFSK